MIAMRVTFSRACARARKKKVILYARANARKCARESEEEKEGFQFLSAGLFSLSFFFFFFLFQKTTKKTTKKRASLKKKKTTNDQQKRRRWWWW
jgi:hypothetical protein